MSDRRFGVRFLMMVLVIAGLARANPVCAEVLARSTFDADSEGTRDSLAGVAATQADMKTVLGALTAVYIRGEYLLNMDDVGQLDNVILNSFTIH